MTTKYTHRVTIAVPAVYIADANQLALCLGESASDDQTFTTAKWQDADGNLYAVCSTVAKPVFAQMAGQPLVAPDHAPDVDLEATTRAQQLLVIGSLDSPVTAAPDRIAVILGGRLESAQEHIAALGLVAVEHPEPISINHDDAERLTELNGVGASLAQHIIDGRPWAELHDLSSISGISTGMIDGWLADDAVSL
ncbi:hypothetical protein [uncultured Halomonas sp.]|uniref:ComEA family DNA-binding protein n=1 Tax=uncultured Halomonas sp. TaxID=173971 RepID=UPI00262B482E|nr:hypothetical protein [uncultured Halomonas sp.]